ncbi:MULTISPECIES: ferrochelatase [Providencia]|uniref:Ferrochelatase n=1 Tax=Providencia rettgeri TaxID=587 RepID=A0A379FNL8_PRORE|nr:MULTISPECIES: ferrochelatase [Providencia]EJD6378860.1 ferrochelatase [Providencia rettgeri]EJF7711963.1 ferrochelatase [Providencia rettgeri]ELR5116656.1 ferrochelatase [Providencia rettgeri]MBI6201401.1 ferrochelatase [Providencia rettgeri]MCG5278965.1 ferrochelatase [Providencia rettgeri]
MSEKKYGILLANLGTPDAPTTSAVKRYLAEFLSDKRVIDVPRLIWKPILHGAILPLRSSKVAKLYKSIWLEGGSPLLVYSLRQKQKLAELLPNIAVEIGMSYGSPSIKSAVDSLLDQGVTDLVVLPLYPQYSCTTTAAVYDALTRAFESRRTIPSVQFIRSYATHPAYIQALVASIEASFALHGEPDRLILSFHGIPQRYCDTGDIYQQECEKTAEALREALNYPSDKVMLTYQSRFGREPWLMPYMDKTMHELPSQGVKSVQVICPGFSVDCLETLEEISEQNKEFFMSSGGNKYNYIPALNDNPNSIHMINSIIQDVLK